MYIEIDCNKCSNCTGDECLKYGADADQAVKQCAQDAFRNYVINQPAEVQDNISN